MAAPRARQILLSTVAFGTVLMSAACGSTAAPVPAANQKAAAAPANPPTGTVEVADSNAPTSELKTATAGQLGTIVTDAQGFTLYRFDKDTAKPPKSNCEGECATAWPPVTVADEVATQGVDKAQLGTVDRSDGTKQLTIAGWPMYRYAKDAKAGDTTGEAVAGAWWATAPNGARAKDKVKASAPGTTIVKAMDVKPFGKVLTDGQGFTLYRFDKDTANPPKSNCDGDCATTWPPVKAEDNVVAEGVDKALVGSVVRTDGSKQLTVAGWPVYRYIKDTGVCQTNGEGVGGVWFVAAPDGKKAKDKKAAS